MMGVEGLGVLDLQRDLRLDLKGFYRKRLMVSGSLVLKRQDVRASTMIALKGVKLFRHSACCRSDSRNGL